MPQRPLIALADPNWIGHRATYFREFVRSLNRVDADVIALCPDPASLDDLQNAGDLHAPKLMRGQLTEPARLPLLGRWPQDPVNTQLRWHRLASALRRVEKENRRTADFLFLPWLDCYLRASLNHRLSFAQICLPWAGLYFRSHHLTEQNRRAPNLKLFFQAFAKGDALLQANSCRAVATLDETLRSVLEKTSRKQVILFPDITDESQPDAATPFARQIRDTARGRKVIGLIGMEPRKGVVTMLRAADIARGEGRPWLFVLAGVYYPEAYPADERRFIDEQITRSRDAALDSNVLFPPEFVPVPDGAVYNGVAETFDVLFVAYHDFLGSSNVLTKAAILKKPVVCTDLGCIAQRTKIYDLGLVIPQGDATACCAAIERAIKGVNWNDAPLLPRHAEYYALHDRAALDASMRQLIALI